MCQCVSVFKSDLSVLYVVNDVQQARVLRVLFYEEYVFVF